MAGTGAALPGLEYLMSISAEVGELVNMGPAPLGERRVVSITGGTFAAARRNPRRHGLADCMQRRRDRARRALCAARGARRFRPGGEPGVSARPAGGAGVA